MEQEKKSNNKGVLVLLLLSLLGNGFLGYKFFAEKQDKETVTVLKEKADSEIESLIDVRVALESELTNTKSDLDKFKGYSAELDSLLADARQQIDAKEKRIAGLSKDSRKLKELQKELADLKSMRDSLLEQVDKLVMENNLLKKENQEYQATIGDLNLVKGDLERKVESGSVLTVNNVVALPYKEKSSGKKSVTAIAKKADLIEICFDVAQNRIAPQGPKEVYARIISPEGSTIAVQSQGSGTFKSKESGEDNLYTTKKTINYDGAQKNHCLGWKSSTPFAAGKYKVEIYVDGYLTGVGGLIMK
jgi:myosin heavy subunit